MRIQSEGGQPKGPDIYVPFEAIPFDEEKYPLLSSVAPYYDTVFNPDQCTRLVAEFDQALSDPLYKERVQDFQIAADAAARCAEEHLYLKFIGD